MSSSPSFDPAEFSLFDTPSSFLSDSSNGLSGLSSFPPDEPLSSGLEGLKINEGVLSLEVNPSSADVNSLFPTQAEFRAGFSSSDALSFHSQGGQGLLGASPVVSGDVQDDLLNPQGGSDDVSDISKEIIFIDAGVEDPASLMQGILPGAEIVWLAGDRDGVNQISEVLAQRNNISAVHVLSHGDAGEVRLGSTVLNQETLGQYTQALQGWSASLTQDADLLFYGCNVAADESDTAFVQQLARLTGADVAASDDLTGNASLGGDWDLEVKTGAIETGTLTIASYEETLVSLKNNTPVIFIPGFGGSFVKDPGELTINPTDDLARTNLDDWYVNRGLSPDRMGLEPLGGAYDDIVQSLQNVGYTLYEEGLIYDSSKSYLFVAAWDWRLPVAGVHDGSDTSLDGNLTGVLAQFDDNTSSDPKFESGVDYLGYWLEKAASFTSQSKVDLISHSTGGLVARSYIQSDAYGATLYAGTSHEITLPTVEDLVLSGVPNQGTTETFNFLQDDWNSKTAALALSRLVNKSYDLVTTGNYETINGSDVNFVWNDGTDGNEARLQILDSTTDEVIVNNASKEIFASYYVRTLNDLLATFEFFDTNNSDDLNLQAFSDTDSINSLLGGTGSNNNIHGIKLNSLILDLNSTTNGEQAIDPNAFIGEVDTTTIHYGSEVDTKDRVQKRVGPASLTEGGVFTDGVQSFTAILGISPQADQVWYQDLSPGNENGDGTVTRESAVGQFIDDSRINLKLQNITNIEAGIIVDHLGLVQNPYSQKSILQAIGVNSISDNDISTELALSRVKSLFKAVDLGILSLDDLEDLTQDVADNINAATQYLLSEWNEITDNWQSININGSLNSLSGSLNVHIGDLDYSDQIIVSGDATLKILGDFNLSGLGSIIGDGIDGLDTLTIDVEGAVRIAGDIGGLGLNALSITADKGFLIDDGANISLEGDTSRLSLIADTGLSAPSWLELFKNSLMNTQGTKTEIQIMDADLSAADIHLITNTSTTKYSKIDIFEDGLTGFLAGQTLASFNTQQDSTSLVFSENPTSQSTITRDKGSWIEDGFEAGQVIKVIGSQFNDENSYEIDFITNDTITLISTNELKNEEINGLVDNITIKQALTSLLPEDVPITGEDINGNPLSVGDIRFEQISEALRTNIAESKIFDLNLPFEALISTSESLITIGTGASISAINNVVIEASAVSDTTLNTPTMILGAAYVSSGATAKTLVKTGAQITAGNELQLQSMVTNNMTVTVTTASNKLLDLAGEYLKIPGPQLSFAYGKARSVSDTTIESGAKLETKNADILAKNNNKFEVSTFTKGKDKSGLGLTIGVPISDTESSSNVNIFGEITATNNLKIDTQANNNKNSITSNSVLNKNLLEQKKSELIEDPIKKAAKNSLVTLLQENNLKAPNSLLNSQKPISDIAVSFGIVDSLNQAKSYVGDGAVIRANGNLDLISNAKGNFKSIVIGQATFGEKGASTGFGGAVSIANYKNTANAFIDSATVDVGKELNIKAIAVIPNQIFVDEDLQAIKSFDPDLPLLDDDSPTELFESVDSAVIGISQELSTIDRIAPYISKNLGVADRIATTFVGAAADIGNSGEFAISGSVNLLTVANEANAFIGNGAKINADVLFSTQDQIVKVNAETLIETINIAGIPNITYLLSPPSKSKGSSVGGTYNQITYNNVTAAFIDDGAEVNAKDINVIADATNFTVNVIESGTGGGTFGVSGAVAVNNFTNHTYAYIEDQAKVNADNNLVVDATTESFGLAIGASNGLVSSSTSGVGASVAVNDLSNETKAFIGNRNTATGLADGSIKADSDIEVTAYSEEKFLTISIAGMRTANATPATPSTPPADSSNSDGASITQSVDTANPNNTVSNVQQKSGIGISGDVSINTVHSTTHAFIGNVATVTADNDLTIDAQNHSFLLAVSGAFTLEGTKGNGGVALAGSFNKNDLNRDVRAFTEQTNLEASNVKITALTDGKLISVAAGGAGDFRDGTLSVAGSVNLNLTDSITIAALGNNTHLTATGSVDVGAKNDLDLISVAGGVSVSGKLGVGAAVDVSVLNNTVDALIGKDAVVNASGNIKLHADSDLEVISVGASLAVATKQLGVSGSASSQNVASTVQAYIDEAAQVNTSQNLLIDSDSRVDVIAVGGAAAFGKTAGVGAGLGNSNLTHTVKSYIGNDSQVSAKGQGSAITDLSGMLSGNGIVIDATATDNIYLFGGGGSGAKSAAFAGSAVVNTVNNTVEAFIGENVLVNGSNTDADIDQSVLLNAEETTNVVSVAGSIAGSGTTGIGAAADIEVITKQVKAYISADAQVNAANNILVNAHSKEDLLSISAGAVGTGTTAIAGTASVITLNNTTQAYIDDGATAIADGNIAIAANNETEIDSIAGNITGSGTASIGASAAITVVEKTTEAFVGEGAVVQAKAQGTQEITAKTGEFDISFTGDSGSQTSEVHAPGAQNADLNQDGENDDVNNPALTQQRAATARTQSLKGLAITAVNQDDIETIAASGSASGNAAVNLSGGVNLMKSHTSAYIDDNAQVNANNSEAGDTQSVLVAAGNDYYHMGISAVGSVASTVGVTPGAGVTVVENQTKAFIDDGATVNTKGDIIVVAQAQDDILSVAAGVAASGVVALGGAASVIDVDSTTHAYIGDQDNDARGATANAGGNIRVSAQNDTETFVLTGRLGVGIGAAGVGGATGVTTIKKDTQAFIGNDSMVNAQANTGTSTQGLSVTATSTEDVFNVAASGAGGLYAGLAGGVSIESIDSNTTAFIGNNAQINQNQTNIGNLQSVQVLANNTLNVFAFGGGIAAGGVGIGGGVDVGIDKNDTTAYIGNNATILAQNNVDVQATSTKEINSYGLSGAGGSAAVAGSVSVWSIGTGRSSTYSDGNSSADSLNTNGFNSTLTNSENQSGEFSKLLKGYVQSNSNGVAGKIDDAKPSVRGSLTAPVVPAGTAAFIGNATTIVAGNNITVDATTTINFNALAGSAAIGAVGIGGSVVVATIDTNATAYVGPNATLTAGNDITVAAQQTAQVDGESYAGQAGLAALGAQVVVLNNTSDQTAYLGQGVNISHADTVAVKAVGTETFNAKSMGGQIGGLVAGASIAKISSAGHTQAYVGNQVQIGQSAGLTVNNLVVTAQRETDSQARAIAVSAGIVSGNGTFTASQVNPTVNAFIGDNAAIQVSQDVLVLADGQVTSEAISTGKSLASGVSAGVSLARASATPTISSQVGAAATIAAGRDITVESRYNLDDQGNGIGGVKTQGNASAAAVLLGATGVDAEANSTVNVTTTIKSQANLQTGNDLKILSAADNNLETVATGNADGVLAGGATIGNITTNSNVNTQVNANSHLQAQNNLFVDATATTTAITDVNGGAGTTLSDSLLSFFRGLFEGDLSGVSAPSLLSVAAATSTVTVNNTANVTITDNADLSATNQVTIEATATTTATPDARMKTEGATLAFATAFVQANVDSDALITLSNHTQINGNEVDIDADNQVKVKTFAQGFAEVDVEGAFGTGISKLNLGSANDAAEAKINLGNADITGRNRLLIEATNTPTEGNLISRSQGKAETNLFVGVAVANADGSANVKATIESGHDAALTSGDLEVHSESNLALQRTPEAIAENLITKTLAVVREVTETIERTVCNWLPWPLDKLCKVVTSLVTKLVEVLEEVSVAATSFTSQGGTGLSITDVINLNGDIFNLGTQDRFLRINADGSVDPTSNVGVTFDANGNAIVDDIVADPKTNIKFLTRFGEVKGDAIIHIDKVIGRVDVENYSNKNLVFQSISMINESDVEVKPDVTYVKRIGKEYDFDETLVESVLNVHNVLDSTNTGTQNSNIIFTKSISNVTGFIKIDNDRGSIITDDASVYLEGGDVGDMVLIADDGNIGEANDRFDVRLSRGKLMPDGMPADMPAELVANTSGNLWLGLQGTNYQAQASDIADGFALHLTGDAGIDLAISKSQVVVSSMSSTGSDIQQFFDTTGLYNIVRANSTTGNINLAFTQSQTGSFILGSMSQFLAPGNVPVNAVMGLTTTIANETQSGLVSASGVVTMTTSGNGSILDGDTDSAIDVQADAAVFNVGSTVGTASNHLNTQLNRLEASVGNSLWLANKSSNLTIGNISSRVGVTNGDLVEISNQGDILLTEAIVATDNNSLVKLTSLAGSILDDSDGGSNDIQAAQAILQAQQNVGQSNNALETQLAKIEAKATSGGVWINNTGDLEIGGISSLTGISASTTIEVSADSSITTSEVITAATGAVLLEATDDIAINAALASGGAATLLANDDVTFGSGGSIHTESGRATVIADADGVAGGGITMTDGSVIDAQAGLIEVNATNDIILSLLQTTADVVVTSSGGAILDNETETISPKDILANSAVLLAATGIGTSNNPLETDLAKLEADGGSGGIYLDDENDLVIGTITTQPEGLSTNGLIANGTIRVNTTGAMTVAEDVESTAANVLLTTIDLVSYGQDFTLVSGTQVTAATTVDLFAGDDILIGVNTTVEAGGIITIQGDVGNADAGVGTEINLQGQILSQQSFQDYNVYIQGDADEDTITLTLQELVGNTIVQTGASDDSITVNQLPSLDKHDRDLSTRDELTLDGGAGSDRYTINITGANTDYRINVFDTGTGNQDELTIYGTDQADEFLLRASDKEFVEGGVAFVAALHGTTNGEPADVERINYNKNIESLVLETLAGDDNVTLDDNWAETVIRGGAGDDAFQVGQIFKSERDAANANLADEDEFATTATTRGFLSNGVSFTTMIQGEAGEDEFTVFRNVVALNLDGGADDDLFTIRSFATEGSQTSQVEAGEGSDTVEYVANAAVDVNGGDGSDTLRVTGTEFADKFLVRADGIYGAGRVVTFEAIENVEIDGAEGEDEFYVQSTAANVVTKLFGGLGSDYFSLGGDSATVDAGLPDATNPLLDANGNVLSQSAPTAHTVNAIQGELIIDGFSPTGSAGGLGEPVLLPGETNLLASTGAIVQFTESEAGQARTTDQMTVLTADLDAAIATLNALDDDIDNLTDLIGLTLEISRGTGLRRFWQITDVTMQGTETALTLQNPAQPDAAWGIPDQQSEYAITALSANFFVNEDLAQDKITVFEDGDTDNNIGTLTDNQITGLGMTGGVTYTNFEQVEILLGQGDDNFMVENTADGTITAVHGGGGNDTLTALNRGGQDVRGENGEIVFEASLALFGDTTEDGSRYSSSPSTVEPGIANGFTNSGDDTINASAMIEMSENVIIYGGDGNDIIMGSQADDHLAGGSGNDTISGLAGLDHIYGDSGFNLDLATCGLTVVTQPSAVTSVDDLTAGSDTIDGGEGADVIFGDHGVIEQSTGIQRILTTDNVERIYTNEFANGEADTILGGAGDDHILGGSGGDTITDLLGNNIVIGDQGAIDYSTGDDDLSTVDLIQATDTANGAGDNITTALGNDIILGGNSSHGIDADTINAGNGNNIVLSDFGQITFNKGNLERIVTTDYALGGDDTIATGDGDDIVLGGVGSDSITTAGGNDIVLGDNGVVDLVIADGDPSDIDLITSTQPTIGGSDTISTGAGNDIVIAGTGNDTVSGGADNDLIFGDHGKIEGDIDANLLPLDQPVHPFTFTSIDTQNSDAGGADDLSGDAGADIIIGGQDSDTLRGGAGDDDLIGGHNVANGHDAGDQIDGGADHDAIAGDNASILPKGDAVSDRFRQLSSSTIYDSNDNPQIAPVAQSNPTGATERVITLFNHSDSESTDTFGNDYIAGGAQDDTIFGQLGNDTIQGDGSIDETVAAYRNADGTLTVDASVEDRDGVGQDGDDYIEGNGGDDVIFGNLGQDDIIGGNSSLFSLSLESQRSDGSDLIFGGAGTDISRNHLGDESVQGHARDADTIVGDNGNIYRLVNTNNGFLEFNYDQTSGAENRGDLRIIPRAVELLDYTPGGAEYDLTALADHGAADEIHGESGDDEIYGMTGADILFGEGQDDNLIGGYSNDWISGGTGEDGVIGDDGRIYTSRNGTAETLFGIAATTQEDISTPGNIQQATIHVTGELKKTVNLTPFNVQDRSLGYQDPLYDAQDADDVIYGGWGDDFLHGGAGDDAISGAEALAIGIARLYDENGNVISEINLGYDTPTNPGNVLGFEALRLAEFAEYDEFNPINKILIDGQEYFLNFNADEGERVGVNELGNFIYSDGNDVLFGALGNDWLVGGTGRDHLYGGWGNDLLNADDNLSTNGGLNDQPDTHLSYEDIAFGGAGRDILIGNTGGDRLIDWAGEFNSYIVPFAPFGKGTVSRAPQPQLVEFLYALSASDGADATRSADTNADPSRNGEPEGELGLVIQKDAVWGDQTEAPNDPQPGNLGGTNRDVLRSANNDDGQGQTTTTLSSSTAVDSDNAVGLFETATPPGVNTEIAPNNNEVTIHARIEPAKLNGKNTQSPNGLILFDYVNAEEFKFAGFNAVSNTWVIGHRNLNGWHIDEEIALTNKGNKPIDVKVSVQENVVSLTVNHQMVLTHLYPDNGADGLTLGLLESLPDENFNTFMSAAVGTSTKHKNK